MTKKRSLAVKLSLIVLVSTSAIFFAAFGATYFTVRSMMLNNAEAMANKLTDGTVNHIHGILGSVMAPAQPLAAAIERDWLQGEALYRVLDDLVQRSPRISGAAVAYEPFSVDPDERYYAPFSYEQNGEIRRTFLGGEDLHYFVRDWYQIPKETGRGIWTDPYHAEGGADELIATYSLPLYRDHSDPDTFIGVIALDVSLTGMLEMISDVSIYETGFAFMVSSSGAFVTYPEPELVRNESFFSLAETWGIPELRQIGRAMVQDTRGFVRLPDMLIGESAWLYYAPLEEADWNLGVVIPERELYGDVLQLIQRILVIAAVGFIILLVVIIGVSRSITQPLKRLVKTASQIAKGNLDEKMPPEKSGDEVGELARSFDEMRVALKDYINNLTETTKAKERIESELLIAQKIQMSFLPKKYSLPASVQGIDLNAQLVPAKHVGGDLYDFFMLKDRYLFFAVGDVSDKGVPAALLMAVTKTLVKGIAEQYSDPGEILERVNNELCFNNENSMFVTYICGLLDVETWELSLGNAGHNLPLLRRAGRPPEWLELTPGLVLGAMEDMQYEVRKIQLKSGDSILFYTDGVVEAEDNEQVLYGDDRLLDLYAELVDQTPKQAVTRIIESVSTFVDGAPQSDDITVLALDYRPVSPRPQRQEHSAPASA